jgi:nucleotide-binding universal stress UspA family protein
MSYGTILVHLNDSRRASRLLAYSVELARAFEARLIGLHVFPALRLKPPIPLPVGEDVLGSLRWSIDEEGQHIKSLFDETTVSEAFVGEWRSITSERTDPARIVVARARAVDLVVASQADPTWDLSILLDFPERLAIESGRPVLVVPNHLAVAALPKSVVIAWNPSREATRALFDALPLLKGAHKVQLLTIDERDHPGEGAFYHREDVLPVSAIAEVLRCHGVKATISEVKPGITSIGELLCGQAIEHETDLLVMGAYGHARLREFVFGGATRHVFRNMTIPVLFSH